MTKERMIIEGEDGTFEAQVGREGCTLITICSLGAAEQQTIIMSKARIDVVIAMLKAISEEAVEDDT